MIVMKHLQYFDDLSRLKMRKVETSDILYVVT